MRTSGPGTYKRIEEADVGKWVLVCGKCGREWITDQTHNRWALAEAREAGWGKNRKLGWVCASCRS